jgi:flagellar biosynthetic protein FliQ
MTPEFAVHTVSEALMVTFWLCVPLLALGFAVGVAINLVQIATSLQDAAVSTIPRLAAFFVGILLLLPYMFGKLSAYTIAILGDLGRYAK